MLDIAIFSVIGLLLAFSSVAHVYKVTGNQHAAALAGVASFMFCLWATGNLWIGCVILVVAVGWSAIPTQS